MAKWRVEPEDKSMLEHWNFKVTKEESTFDTDEEAWAWYDENADGLIDDGFGDVEVIGVGEDIEYNKAFVTTDGEYGVGVVTFSEDALTIDQWEDVSEMSPESRYDYVVAILGEDSKTATKILEENGLRQG
jgi:hypothetical protein